MRIILLVFYHEGFLKLAALLCEYHSVNVTTEAYDINLYESFVIPLSAINAPKMTIKVMKLL